MRVGKNIPAICESGEPMPSDFGRNFCPVSFSFGIFSCSSELNGEVFPEVDLERISICAIATVVPAQVLFKAATRKRDSFALETCAIVVDQVTLKHRDQQGLAERLLGNRVAYIQRAHEAKIAALAHLKCDSLARAIRCTLNLLAERLHLL